MSTRYGCTAEEVTGSNLDSKPLELTWLLTVNLETLHFTGKSIESFKWKNTLNVSLWPWLYTILETVINLDFQFQFPNQTSVLRTPELVVKGVKKANPAGELRVSLAAGYRNLIERATSCLNFIPPTLFLRCRPFDKFFTP